MNKLQLTQYIKQESKILGFEHCGIAKAQRLEEDERRLDQWLSREYNGKMEYMARHFDLRVDPTKLVPGAKSVITFLYNYFPKEEKIDESIKISKYAYGADYHEIIRPKLTQLFQKIKEKAGNIQGRGFVDSAPVLERSWAQKSGLGWIGKNANLITKHSGSFFFIATLIIDLELEYDNHFVKDYCGNCTKCIDACPTEAIIKPTMIDGSKCISYLTIELKDELIPKEFNSKMENWMFGCDICQDVCPWNRFSRPHTKEELRPNESVFQFDINDWLALEEDQFKILLKNSPLKRSKYKGIMRNVSLIKSTQ